MPDFGCVQTLAAAQHNVICADQARGCGMGRADIERMVRRRQWRRLRTGVYYTAAGAPPLAARAKAAQLVHGPRAVVVGPTAARLWGLQGVVPGPGYEHVHLSVPSGGSRGGAGVRAYGWDVPPGETAFKHGIRLTTPGRTLRDTVLLVDRYSAVSLIDSALQQGLAGTADLAPLRDANRGRRGAPHTRGWWSETDGRAQSTFETRLRLTCADAGLPPEALQYAVYREDGALAGHADLAWPSWSLIAEADGEDVHALPAALYTDRTRQNRIAAAPGRLTVLRFTWSDLRHPAQIAHLIRSARNPTAEDRG